MSQFLRRYYREWDNVYECGITPTEAIFNLVQILPARWQPWAREQAVEFINSSWTEERVGQSLLDFTEVIGDQYKIDKQPPPMQYVPGATEGDRVWLAYGYPLPEFPGPPSAQGNEAGPSEPQTLPTEEEEEEEDNSEEDSDE